MDEVASPCINLCQMDPDTGWCRGCLRTIDEIAAWGSLDNQCKRTLRVELSRRRVIWRANRGSVKLPTTP